MLLPVFLFQEDLTEQEIIDLVEQAAQIMKEKSYEEVFRWMKQVLEQYPNCEPLSLNFAAILDAQGIFQGVSEQEKYEKFICGWYERALDRGYTTELLLNHWLEI